jgi:hypothetical protein
MLLAVGFVLFHSSAVSTPTQWDRYSPLGPDEYGCVVSRLGTSNFLRGIVRLSFQVKNTCTKPVRIRCSFQANGTDLPSFDVRLAPTAVTEPGKHSVILPRASQYSVVVASPDCEFSFVK